MQLLFSYPMQSVPTVVSRWMKNPRTLPPPPSLRVALDRIRQKGPAGIWGRTKVKHKNTTHAIGFRLSNQEILIYMKIYETF